jgi:Xaa-Pro aminopeptidase
MLQWRTLSFAPIDRRLIAAEALDPAARDWLNAYHAQVAEKIGPRVSPVTKLWLDAATAPL